MQILSEKGANNFKQNVKNKIIGLICAAIHSVVSSRTIVSYHHADKLGLSAGNSVQSVQPVSACSSAATCANSC